MARSPMSCRWSAKRRGGLSLVELLVVIAIVSILVLMLMPALQSAREMGRRTQCINHQRNLAVAMVNYVGAHNTFPAALVSCTDDAFNSLGRQRGVPCAGPNWASQILSQMDEELMYDQLIACLRTEWHACDDCPLMAGRVGSMTPGYFICPSAIEPQKLHQSPRTRLSRLAKGNYVACMGSEHYRTGIEGNGRVAKEADDHFQIGIMTVRMIPNYAQLIRLTKQGVISGEWKFADGRGTEPRKIKDGLSKTIVLSELLTFDGRAPDPTYSEDIRGIWTLASMGASTYTHKYGPNSAIADRINGCEEEIPRDHPLFCEQAKVTGPESAETWASARSAHHGGVVGALADASVRFFSDDIHLPVWQALATRAGGDN